MKYIVPLILITLLSTITYPTPNTVVLSCPTTSSSQKPPSFSKLVSEHKCAAIVSFFIVASGAYIWYTRRSSRTSTTRVPVGVLDSLRFNMAIESSNYKEVSTILAGPPLVDPSTRIQSKTLLEMTQDQQCSKVIAQHIFRYKKSTRQNRCSKCKKFITSIAQEEVIGILRCCHALFCSRCQSETHECQHSQCAHKESRQDRALLFSEDVTG